MRWCSGVESEERVEVELRVFGCQFWCPSRSCSALWSCELLGANCLVLFCGGNEDMSEINLKIPPTLSASTIPLILQPSFQEIVWRCNILEDW
jgi:hypothetical protein